MIRVLPIRIASKIWPTQLLDLCAFASRGVFADFLGQPLGIIKRRRAADIMFEQIVELRGKSWVLFCRTILAFEIEHERHQGFGHITPTKLTKMATFVWLVAERVGRSVHKLLHSVRVEPSRDTVQDRGASRLCSRRTARWV
jgi:hypothetical protein